MDPDAGQRVFHRVRPRAGAGPFRPLPERANSLPRQAELHISLLNFSLAAVVGVCTGHPFLPERNRKKDLPTAEGLDHLDRARDVAGKHSKSSFPILAHTGRATALVRLNRRAEAEAALNQLLRPARETTRTDHEADLNARRVIQEAPRSTRRTAGAAQQRLLFHVLVAGSPEFVSGCRRSFWAILGNARREPWEIWHSWQRGICKLRILVTYRGSESHSHPQ